MSDKAWMLAGDVMLYAFAGVTTLFVLLYAVFSPWWKTETGKNIMAVMGVLGAALVYFGYAVWVGRIPEGFEQIRLLLFAGGFVSVGWRVVIFVRRQILARNTGQTKEEADESSG